jgi:transcriptional regulator with XRE-family HTH domain
MNEISVFIGKQIRQLREAKKISQQELGNLLNYSPMAISYFEAGTREIKNSDLKKIAEFFKVQFASFFPAETTLFRAEEGNSPEAVRSLKSFDEHLDKLNE